jgi:glycosyltransferase involved in cell wall biosynthesis
VNRPLVAFYAPLKSPDHPVASGDRTMGRAIGLAIHEAGFAVERVSDLRLYDGAGDMAVAQRLERAARGEAERYIAACNARPFAERPVAFVTYHCYFKAPDIIGPHVAKALGIPYVIFEPSSAGKRRHGRWAWSNRRAEAAFDAASALMAMTQRDLQAMVARAGDKHRVRYFPPFLARHPDPAVLETVPRRDGPNLITIAMMRASNKLQSYLALAAALRHLADLPWRLDIAGDGPARGAVKAAFAEFGDRVAFHGLISQRERLDALCRAADLFVWPGVTEAYGMSLLEAQACGIPCVAGRDGGVPDVVMDGRTGILVEAGDPRAFARAVRQLWRDPDLRLGMGRQAAKFVREERSLAGASRHFGETMKALLAGGSREGMA